MNSPPANALCCNGLSISVPGRSLVENLGFDLRPGESLAILGQNGSGKSLTLHTLAGLRPAAAGSIVLQGQPVVAARRKSIARHLALLPQHTDDIFPSTVLETVLIGRHPHIERFQWESAADRHIACAALREVDLEALADRDVATLSGGERRRVAIAQVLAQAPDVFLLDEPTNHLDPQHQLEVLQLFRRRSQAGNTVIMSLHDVNLAVRFADRCLLLYGDGRWQLGGTTSILNAANLTELYATPIETVAWRDCQLFIAAGAAAAGAVSRQSP
jgi:iron complex transport system ATP-binding protein